MMEDIHNLKIKHPDSRTMKKYILCFYETKYTIIPAVLTDFMVSIEY